MGSGPKGGTSGLESDLQNIQAIKEDCGEVCDLSVKIKFTQGSIFDQVKNFANGPRKQDLQSESHCQ